MAETLEKKNDDERKMHILISEITPEDPNFRHWDSDDLARFLTLFGVKSSLKTLKNYDGETFVDQHKEWASKVDQIYEGLLNEKKFHTGGAEGGRGKKDKEK